MVKTGRRTKRFVSFQYKPALTTPTPYATGWKAAVISFIMKLAAEADIFDDVIDDFWDRFDFLLVQYIDYGALGVNIKSGLVEPLFMRALEEGLGGMFNPLIWCDAKYLYLTATRKRLGPLMKLLLLSRQVS